LHNEGLHHGLATESLVEALLNADCAVVDVMDLPRSEADRRLLASILLKEDEELTAERLDGAVRALRKIHLRRRLEQVQRELQSAVGKEPGQLQQLLQEKMRLKRALMDPGIGDSGTAVAV
jgi:hypothetical protein